MKIICYFDKIQKYTEKQRNGHATILVHYVIDFPSQVSQGRSVRAALLQMT